MENINQDRSQSLSCDDIIKEIEEYETKIDKLEESRQIIYK